MVLKLRSNSPDWFSEEKEAKCVKFPGSREYDPWFGTGDKERLDEHDTEEMEHAKAICKGTFDGTPCPLLADCLEFAVINNEKYGIWGGTDPEERKRIRKDRRIWQRKEASS